MRFVSLSLLLLLAGFTASCGDKNGSALTTTGGTNPRPPINHGDGAAFAPPVAGTGSQVIEDDTPSNPNGGGGNGGGGNGGNSGGGSGGGGGPAAAVPEPGTIFLVGSGLAGLAMVRRRRKQAEATDDTAA